jgi:hypothetical protein
MWAPKTPNVVGGASSKSAASKLGAGTFPTLGAEESSSLDCTSFSLTSFPSSSSDVSSSLDCAPVASAAFLSLLPVVCTAGGAVWALLSSLLCDGITVKMGVCEEECDDTIGGGGIGDGNV